MRQPPSFTPNTAQASRAAKTGIAPLMTIPPWAPGAKTMPPKTNSVKGAPEVSAITPIFQRGIRGQRTKNITGMVHRPAIPKRSAAMS